MARPKREQDHGRNRHPCREPPTGAADRPGQDGTPPQLRRRLQKALDPRREFGRDGLLRNRLGERSPQAAEFRQGAGAIRAGRDMGRQGREIRGGQFPVEERADLLDAIVTAHGAYPSSLADQAARSSMRARARRDITVPIGSASAVAICA